MSNNYESYQFAGITHRDNVEMNSEIQSHYGIEETPEAPLSVVIGALDSVELADLYVKNPYDDDQLIPIDQSNATINPDIAIELAEEKQPPVSDGGFQFGEDRAETSENREPTVEDGDRMTYATHSDGYAAVKHYDFFYPMAKALRQEGISNVTGEFRSYDHGAQVHGEILFQDPDTQLNLPDDRDPLFVGLSVGNSYDGSCAMYAMGYAQDTSCKNSMRNLTEKRTRKHIGDPGEVSEWWNDMLVEMTAMRDILGECIEEALDVELNFIEQPFDVEEFFELLGLPGYLARAAATSARNRSPREGGSRVEINFWALHSGLTSALTHDFSGSSETGALETYSQIAKDILWNPVNTMSKVKAAYEREQRQAAEDDELGTEAQSNLAMIEQYESTLDDRKEQFETFEEDMNELLAASE